MSLTEAGDEAPVQAEAGAGTCPWCSDAWRVEPLEAWGNSVLLDACFEAALQEAHEVLTSGDRRDATDFLSAAGVDACLGGRLRGITGIEDGPEARLDFRLRVGPVPQARAKEFVRAHHRHCRPPAGWRFGLGCWNGPTLVGVAMVGRPVARMLDATRIVEVNRLCIDHSQPAALCRNVASMLYGKAAREGRRRGFSRIITYTLEEESGASLIAAGWSVDGTSPGGSWSRPSRERGVSGPTMPKTRWARDL